jgi:hypothetical protein
MESIRKKFLGPRPSQRRYPVADPNVGSQSWRPFEDKNDDEDSAAGSLFSESEDAGQTNRVRPVTLRPRQRNTISETDAAQRPPKTEPSSSIDKGGASTSKPSVSTLSKHSGPLKSSPTRSIKPRNEPPTNSTSSKPDLTTMSVDSKKRQPEAKSDSSHKKRKLSENALQSKRPQTSQTLAVRAEGETAQEFVTRYWTDYLAGLPPALKELPSIDKLAHYFKESEILRLQNDAIRKEEEERRREMVLVGKKIQLMNQQVRNKDGV